jgi:asparagine N-glycosylation enzyme membrane subunit Stt3
VNDFLRILAVVIGILGALAARYLAALYRQDRREGGNRISLSLVLAIVGTLGAIAGNYLAFLSLLPVLGIPNSRDIQVALTPVTLAVFLVLDVIPILPAAYLWARRRLRVLIDEAQSATRSEVPHEPE